MIEELPEAVWTATFPDDVVLYVYDDAFFATGPSEAAAVVEGTFGEHLVSEPWPWVAGFDVDLTPGWDADLMYHRLMTMGADTVKGPRPPDEPLPEDPDLIVG